MQWFRKQSIEEFLWYFLMKSPEESQNQFLKQSLKVNCNCRNIHTKYCESVSGEIFKEFMKSFLKESLAKFLKEDFEIFLIEFREKYLKKFRIQFLKTNFKISESSLDLIIMEFMEYYRLS